VIDVRCAATAVPDGTERRCQLLAGHTACHAVLVLESGVQTPVRAIRTWQQDTRTELVDAGRASSFPWAPGLPVVEAPITAMPGVVAVSRRARESLAGMVARRQQPRRPAPAR
jgi:hypothetical protein